MRRRDFVLGGAAALGGCATGASILGIGEPVRLETRLGAIEGRVDSDGVRRFLGVPYAAPPLEGRRFKPPEPVSPWRGVRRATSFAPAPMQAASRLAGRPASEDCLYLNVWAPSGPGPHPVYVWVHAGGNEGGSTNDERYDGASFARDGVVCVTITHRVGGWGFLELGDALGPEYAGSAANGLKDQLAALAWVRDNIADYGGDPERVTLGGLSSGAKNICTFLAAPAAAGLFQSAIIESGGGHTVHTAEEAHAIAARFFDSPAMRRRAPRDLLTMSPNQVRRAQTRFLSDYDAAFAFRAVVDGDFLPQRPVDAIAAGSGAGVRVLMGGSHDEGALFLGERRGPEPFTQHELAHMSLADAERAYPAYRALHPELSALDLRVRFISFEEYRAPTMQVADARASGPGGAETWVYRIDWTDRTGRLQGWAYHGVEAPFAWNNVDAEKRRATRSNSAMWRLHGMWTAFIQGRAPEPPGGPAWPRYTAADRRLLVVDDDFRLGAPEDADHAFWRAWM